MKKTANFKQKMAVVALLIAVTSLLLSGFVFAFDGLHTQTVNAGNVDTSLSDVIKKNAGTIDIPGFEKLVFKAGSKEQSVNFVNPIQNTCYFKISLIKEDGTVLWTSDLVKPGETVNQIALGNVPKKGSFLAALRYDCFSLEDKSPLNSAEVKVTVNVS